MDAEQPAARPTPRDAAEFFRHVRERLRLAREAQGWGQRELARQSRVNNATISRVESGERESMSLWTAFLLAEALGLTLEYLAKGEMTSERHPVGPGLAATVASPTGLRSLEGGPPQQGPCA